MQLDAKAYKAAIDLERLFYDMAHQTLDENTSVLFGEPPSFDKQSSKYIPGKSVNIEEIKKTLSDFLLF